MNRRRPPNRRSHEVREFRHGGLRYLLGVGCYDDGSLAEVFLNCEKQGSTADAAAKDSAVVASLALQHGVVVDTIRHALTRNADGSASGPLGAALDIIARGT
jgi:hypothetical protein